MANFPPIQFIRSATPGARPTDSDILVGELAINLRDRILFTKDDSDNIVALGFTPEYDSDILQIIHDYQAADSGQTLESLLNVVVDSDGVDLRSAGKVLGWDSDLQLWRPVTATSVAKVSDLTDVNVEGIRHGQILAWDSDSEFWKPALPTISTMVRDSFIVGTDGQMDFQLTQFPYGDVQIARNGVVLIASAAIDSDDWVIYQSQNNNNQIMRSGDRVDITYLTGGSTAEPNTLETITFQDLSGPVDGGGAAG